MRLFSFVRLMQEKASTGYAGEHLVFRTAWKRAL
jgi:hypothetical protein